MGACTGNRAGPIITPRLSGHESEGARYHSCVSYDLFFLVPKDRKPPSYEEFVAWFKDRANYSNPENPGWYENEMTGVYFSFACDEEEEREEALPDGLKSAQMSFNMNYFRPHIFGLEAEPEVAAFVRRFDLRVEDLEPAGAGIGAYTSEAFLRGWNEGNAFAYKSFEGKGNFGTQTLPTAEIERCWRWNLGVTALQCSLGDQIFVPRIVFIQIAGKVQSMAIWPDGLPIALPDVDQVLLGRQELAPKKLFGRSKKDTTLMARGGLEAVLRFGIRIKEPVPHTLFRSSKTMPAEIEAFFRKLKSDSPKLEGIAVDHILNRELLESSNGG